MVYTTDVFTEQTKTKEHDANEEEGECVRLAVVHTVVSHCRAQSHRGVALRRFVDEVKKKKCQDSQWKKRGGDRSRMKWTGFDFIPIAIMFYACSWLFSNLKGNSVLTNIDDLKFAAVGVTAPDETIFHPIPPVRVEGQGPHLRVLVDAGAHSKIAQQLEKGLISWLPVPVQPVVDVV